MALHTNALPQKYIFYVMEVNKGNCPGFCAIVGNHDALVVDGGVHLPKEYLELEKFSINLKYRIMI